LIGEKKILTLENKILLTFFLLFLNIDENNFDNYKENRERVKPIEI